MVTSAPSRAAAMVGIQQMFSKYSLSNLPSSRSADAQKQSEDTVLWSLLHFCHMWHLWHSSFSFSADSHFKTPSWCSGRTVSCNRRWGLPPGEPCELTFQTEFQLSERHFRTWAFWIFKLKLDVLPSLFYSSYCNFVHCLGLKCCYNWHLVWRMGLWWVSRTMCVGVGVSVWVLVCAACAPSPLMK